MATHKLGVCRENLRRINQAIAGAEEARAGIEKAYTAWTNRADAPEQTSYSATTAQQDVEQLRRQLVGDKTVWLGFLQEAAAEMQEKKDATIAAKEG